MSRATAVQALIDQLKLLPAHIHGQRAHYVQRDSVMAIADDLAALLLREGQEPAT